MKKKTVKRILIFSILCFLIALILFDDSSFTFLGLGIILLAVFLRQIIMDYWEKMKPKK